MNGTWECPQTTSDARSPLASRATSARSFGPYTAMCNSKQPQFHALAVHQLERHDVGHLAGLLVDVAAHCNHRCELGQSIQYRQLADITRVQNHVRLELADSLFGRWVRLGVRVRDDGKSELAVGTRVHSRFAGNGLSRHARSVAPATP